MTSQSNPKGIPPALPKRKVEEPSAGAECKKHKAETITFSQESLSEFKSQIIDAVTSSFEQRLKKLESRIQSLEGSDSESDEESQLKSPPEPENVDTKVESKDKKPTFGSNLFLNANLAHKVTPQHSFTESPTVPNSTRNSPMPPVFGATTSFGGSAIDTLKNRKNVFDALSSQTEVSSAPSSNGGSSSSGTGGASFGTSFGANTKFANALQNSIHKKSFLDETAVENKEGSVEAAPQFKQVDLEKQAVHTGEEDESFTFTTTCKLFALDLTKVSDGWKERGLGPVHVNQLKVDPEQARIVMRSQGLLRVVLNYKINRNTELLKGLEASLNPGKYVRLNSISPEGHPIQYLLKFGSEVLRNEFCEAVEGIKRLATDN